MFRFFSIAAVVIIVATLAYASHLHTHTTSHTHNIGTATFEVKRNNVWHALEDDTSKADSDAMLYRYNDAGDVIGMSLTYGEYRDLVERYEGDAIKHVHRHSHSGHSLHTNIVPQDGIDNYMKSVWETCELVVLLQDVFEVDDDTTGFFEDLHNLDDLIRWHTNIEPDNTSDRSFDSTNGASKASFLNRLGGRDDILGTFASDLRHDMIDWLIKESTIEHIGQDSPGSHTFRYLGNDRHFARKNRWKVVTD